MAINPALLITNVGLEVYFVDKTTGGPLSGGFVYFFEDESRVTPKLVYEQTGAPPNYTYVPLPNPITLSAVGTILDNSGNDVPIYYYPYDAAGNLELYYIVVTDSAGLEQFVREGWPHSAIANPAGSGSANIANQLTNPQFVNVLFNPSNVLTITIAGAGTTNVNIAPGWTLNITTTGASTVTVQRTAITGVTAYPFNPPYTLTITPGANITVLTLSQKLNNNPSIWSPQNAGSTNGYIGASLLLAPLSSVSVYYAPSVGAQQLILAANNTTGLYSEFTGTVQLTPAANTDSSNTGFVNIVIQLSTTLVTTLSNLQIVGLNANQTVLYDQTPVNRQYDYMFNYFNPLLQYKPIRSYLVGWDFPLNPTQALGPTLAASAAGANTSRYVWDQTIVFQTANSGPAISRGTNGCLTITATNTTQFALVQYLEQSVARMILNDRNSVNLTAFTAHVGGLGGTVSLWYTTDGALPSCAANNSIVATLSAAGKPLTFNGTWVEVPRSNLGDATFTIGASPTTTNFNNYGFNGWDLQGIAATNTATFFAIVVGFASLTAASSVNIDSISLVPGDIPTRPAPLTGNETSLLCKYYYNKTFLTGTVPATNVGLGTGECVFIAYENGIQNLTTPPINFVPEMIGTPNVIFYNPAANNAQARNASDGADCTLTQSSFLTAKTYGFQCTTDAGSIVGSHINVHMIFDSRLGR